MRKLSLEVIQADAARYGGRCVSGEYVDSLTPMEWECASGHRWRAVAHSIRQGHWCKKCADRRLRHDPERVHALAALRGGKCLGQYTNIHAKMEWQCAAGHRWLASFHAVANRGWCPQCRRDARRRQSWWTRPLGTRC